MWTFEFNPESMAMSFPKNISGRLFGRLRAIEPVGKSKNGTSIWRCTCECGGEVSCQIISLTRGHTKSCGCLRKEEVSKRSSSDAKSGDKFGRLILKEKFSTTQYGNRWLCLCDCGNETIATYAKIKNGTVKSCGCLAKELAKKRRVINSGQSGLNALFASYQKSASERNIEFFLSVDKFKELTSSKCYYCDNVPANVKGQTEQGKYIYNGIDRANNKKGYSDDNCRPCCARCNKIKLNMEEKEMWDHLEKMISHRQNKIEATLKTQQEETNEVDKETASSSN